MSMVAQLEHSPPAIDLGRCGAVLHLFSCADLLCPSYGNPCGCAAVVLQHQEIGNTLTAPPPDEHADPVINGELRITGWQASEDAVRADQAALFYEDRSYMELPETIATPFDFAPQWDTKAGGVPYWGGNGVTLDPVHIPCPPFEFLLQIHETVYVDGTPPEPDVIGCDVSTYQRVGAETRWEHRTPAQMSAQGSPASQMSIVHQKGSESFGVDFVNFGSDGTGYVFINREADPPEVRWFWSR